MPLTKLSHLAASNLDAISGSLLGGLTSIGLAGVAPASDGVSWSQVGTSLLVALTPMAIAAIRRWYRGEAAGDRVRAAKLRAKADKCRKAGDEAGAVKLEDKADELDAEAAEKEAKARGGVE